MSNITLIAWLRWWPKKRSRNKCPSEGLVWKGLKHRVTGCTFIDRSFVSVLGSYLAAESENRFGAHSFRYNLLLCVFLRGRFPSLSSVIVPLSVPVKSLDPLRKRWIISIFRLSYVIFDSFSWLRTVVGSLSSVFAKEIANWLPNENIVDLLSAEVNLFFFF